MAGELGIRRAVPEDVAALNQALRQLSADLGDTHRATDAQIAAAAFGAVPVFYAMIAVQEDQIRGAALFSPLQSTTRARAGAYVSDLWVAESQRGQRLGQRLLRSVADEAGALWGAGFIRLAVYRGADRARRFYESVGFSACDGECSMILDGAAMEGLRNSQ